MKKGITIAFIGTGIMGSRVIKNLQKAGFSLRIYNRTASKAFKLKKEGTTICNSPAEAAFSSDVVIASVSNDQASEQIWFGKNGVLQTADKGILAVELSTLSLSFIEKWAKRIDKAGLRPVDCPVTGSKSGAEDGTLSLFLGGEMTDVKELQPILAVISRQQFYFGKTGSGMKFKLIYNMLGATILVALAESMGLAQKLNLNMIDVLRAMEENLQGWAGLAAKSKGKNMVNHEHDDVSCSLGTLHKDLTYALSAAEELMQKLPVSSSAGKVMGCTIKKGYGEKDMSAVAELYIS